MPSWFFLRVGTILVKEAILKKFVLRIGNCHMKHIFFLEALDNTVPKAAGYTD